MGIEALLQSQVIGLDAALAAKLGLSGGTLTGDLAINPTWNAGGTTFKALSVNATDTSSASGSLLADLMVGGTSRFAVRKDGAAYISGAPAISVSGGNVVIGAYTSIGWNTGSVNIETNATLNFGGSVFLQRDAANVLAQRNGTNSQASRLYNTFTDYSNYERLQLAWESNEARIGPRIAGTGTQRAVSIGRWDAAGTFTSALSISAVGAATFASTINEMDFATTNYNLAVGAGTSAGIAFAATALGWAAKATHSYAVSIGSQAASSSANQLTIGDSTNVTKFRFGTGVATVTFDNPLTLAAGSLQFGGTTSSFPAIKRSGAGLQVRLADDSGFAQIEPSAMLLTERTAPAAPSANQVVIYAEDDGSGKTRLMALFSSGAAQQLAIEP